MLNLTDFTRYQNTLFIKHLNASNILIDEQFGFRVGLSCEVQLSVVRIILLELTYSALIFDTVPYCRLLNKIQHYGIQGELHAWLDKAWLTQRVQHVVVNGHDSNFTQVKNLEFPRELFWVHWCLYYTLMTLTVVYIISTATLRGWLHIVLSH